MNYNGFRRYYARSGLNPNKRDKPNQLPEKQNDEPELVKRMRTCEKCDDEKIRKYDSSAGIIKKENQ